MMMEGGDVMMMDRLVVIRLMKSVRRKRRDATMMKPLLLFVVAVEWKENEVGWKGMRGSIIYPRLETRFAIKQKRLQDYGTRVKSNFLVACL